MPLEIDRNNTTLWSLLVSNTAADEDDDNGCSNVADTGSNFFNIYDINAMRIKADVSSSGVGISWCGEASPSDDAGRSKIVSRSVL